jgi:hypothetical protein
VSNYAPKLTYKKGKFELEIHPYVAAPENRFDPGAAVQYGADFKCKFEIAREGGEKLGLLQLIFPQTVIFPTTVARSWNVDKHLAGNDLQVMAKCLYGNDNTTIGVHSEHYKGSPMRLFATNSCWLIDTPREISASFRSGTFVGQTNTKFANYAVELKGRTGVIFDTGIIWGYSVIQDSKDGSKFSLNVVDPKECSLKESNAHQAAIGNFLGVARSVIATYVS